MISSKVAETLRSLGRSRKNQSSRIYNRKCHFVHISIVHNFGGPLPPPPHPTSKAMDFLLIFFERTSNRIASAQPKNYIGQRLRWGQNVSREFGGGGNCTAECALQNHFWRPQKLGLVWSGPLSFKGNDRESPKKGGGKRIVGGGSKNVFGEGFFAEFTVCFPP